MYKKLNNEDELRSQHRAAYNLLFSRLSKSQKKYPQESIPRLVGESMYIAGCYHIFAEKIKFACMGYCVSCITLLSIR